MKLVTVLMSVYNDERYLSDSIESILKQTFTDFEFLIIDDGSTDSTAAILSRYAYIDSRVRIHTLHGNRGLGYCLNLGVSLAMGKFIARMDADDISRPDRLQRQVLFFQDNQELDVLGSYAVLIDEYGNGDRVRSVPLTKGDISRNVWSNPFIHSSVMFKKESILRIGSYMPKLARRQDYELWFRAVKHNLNMQNIADPLISYRFSENTFKKNNVGLMFEQAMIGVRGCFLVGAPLNAYFFVFYPFFRSFFPVTLQSWIRKSVSKFDPRMR